MLPGRVAFKTGAHRRMRRKPLRGALVVGGDSEPDVAAQLARIRDQAAAGRAPAVAPPDPALAAAPVRVAIDYGDGRRAGGQGGQGRPGADRRAPELRKMLRSRGVFIGHGPAPKTAFLYTGPGLAVRQHAPRAAGQRAHRGAHVRRGRRDHDSPARQAADFDYIFVDGGDPAAVARAEGQLLQTEITQPAVLAADLALTRMLAAYGIEPDLVMGHSLGEYGALVAAGALSFAAALEAVSARGREMASLNVPDHGAMAAVMAPLAEIERIVASVDGYVVVANINSTHQAVIGGATEAVERAIEAFTAAGYSAARIPVSHAFHTAIVAPVSEPLRQTLATAGTARPALPIVANVDGEFYPASGPGVQDRMLDILARQVASPVQFVKGLRHAVRGRRPGLRRGRAEAGASRVRRGRARLGARRRARAVHQPPQVRRRAVVQRRALRPVRGGPRLPSRGPRQPVQQPRPCRCQPRAPSYRTLPHREQPCRKTVTPNLAAWSPISSTAAAASSPAPSSQRTPRSRSVTATGRHAAASARTARRRRCPKPVVITGAALGLPGTERVFDDENVARILSGQQFIDVVPRQVRREMVDKHITRLVKSETGDPVFEAIESEGDVIKLAGRYGSFDLAEEFGVDADRDAALDQCTRLAIGVGPGRAARRGHPAGAALPHHDARAPGCPIAGGCPTTCATTPE